MQFKHPEILWALLLLIIPIIIHLFQLRRFQKVAFTNVQFLKQVTVQTRKSSKLKKWLVLFSRILVLTGLIIAFAEPYFANRNILTTSEETVIYLDNSFSMQLKGEKGPLLQRAIQELMSGIPEDEEVTVFTNTSSFPKSTIKSFQNELLQLPYSSNQLTFNEISLRGRNSFEKNANSIKKLIVISDFQQKEANSTFNTDTLITIEVVKLTPVKTTNTALDSVYISKTTTSAIELSVIVSRSQKTTGSYPVSLFNNDQLVAKASAEFVNSNENTVTFTIPANAKINGQLSIEDDGLQYDNTLYFNLNAPEKINVLTINEADNNFLSRIFTNDEFNLLNFRFNELDYSTIENQNLIILNELKNIPNSLSNALNAFQKNGGKLIIIPNEDHNTVTYAQLLKPFGISTFDSINLKEKRITKIQFSHPVYQDVFDKEVSNFQYPKVSKSFRFNNNYSSLLEYEDGTPFLSEKSGIYLFTAPLNNDISNFKNSPLIVPTFYSIAKKSLQLSQLYYHLDTENQVDVKTTTTKDGILNVQNKSSQFIPLQQSYPNKVSLSFSNNPKESGIYSIKNQEIELQNISFNYSRNESILNYVKPIDIGIENVTDSVQLFFDELQQENNINELWKWFIIFALFFLIVELFLLKLLK